MRKKVNLKTKRLIYLLSILNYKNQCGTQIPLYSNTLTKNIRIGVNLSES